MHKLAAVLALGMGSAHLNPQAMVEDTVYVSRAGMEISVKAEASERAQLPMTGSFAVEKREVHV